jgi:hypothetical protein
MKEMVGGGSFFIRLGMGKLCNDDGKVTHHNLIGDRPFTLPSDCPDVQSVLTSASDAS